MTEFITTTKVDPIEDGLKTWSDEEVLRNFFKFFPRVVQVAELIETEEGAILSQVLVTMAGNKIVFSEPQPLDWPLMRVPAPEMDSKSKI